MEQPIQPPQKQVVTPANASSTTPMHKHTAFIIAIGITTLLLILAAVTAYISWDNGLRAASENLQLTSQVASLQQQNTQLQTQVDASTPVPFFYSQFFWEAKESRLHKVDPITKTDTIIATVPNRALTVFAQPRVGYNGTIWLNEFPIGDHDFAAMSFHSFDVEGSGDAVPVAFQNQLNNHPAAIALSPDETRLAVVYSDNQNAYANNAVVVWDLATGQATQIGTIGEGESFASSYTSDILMAEGYSVFWTSNTCVSTGIYTVEEDGDRRYARSAQFCE